MAANVLTRDAILLEALQLADAPSVNVVDVSSGNPHTGTINAGAMSIDWLTNGINYFLSVFPWAATATTGAGNLVAGTATVSLLPNFVLDLKDGLILTVNTKQRRLRRRGLQDLITLGMNQNNGVPRIYTVQGLSIRVAPTPDLNYPYTLWFWERPPSLTGAQVPLFPSDLILVEYVRIKAMEYIRAAPPGAAMQYADRAIAELRKSGLGNETEYDTIPLDPTVFVPGAGDRGWDNNAWMGPVF
jgi:hypothetical protein